MTVGNRDKMKSSSLGLVKGTVANKMGQVISNVTLKDIAQTPQSKFNFLSITKMMGDE